MSMFWLSAGLITIAALGIVVWPLLRAPNAPPEEAGREDYDVEIYKDQLGEVDRDLERGILSIEQAGAARTEIQRKLLAAADLKSTGGKPQIAGRQSNRKLTALVIAVFVGAGAAGLYTHLGTPQFGNLPYADRDIASERREREEGQATNEMMAMLERLSARLKQNPEDVKGWLLLGRSLISVRQYPESVKAYRRARTLLPNDPGVAVDYAEALIFANQGQVDKGARSVLENTLKIAPEDPKVRYYIGLSKAQAKDFSGALQDWTDIAAISPPDAPWMMTVRQQMGRAFNDSGIDPKTITPSPEALEIAKAKGIGTPITQGGSAAPGPTREDMKAASKMSPGDQSKMIRAMVNRLADRLKDAPDDLEGWTRLARAYQVLGETEKARDAQKRIEELKAK